MRKATWSDRKKVIGILTETFSDNPGSLWLLRKGINQKRGLERLCRYVFIKSFVRDGAWISDNEKGVALCYIFNRKVISVREYFSMLWFAASSVSFSRYPEVRYRESYRKSQRPQDGNYLYFWFFGVAKGGGRAAHELGIGMFEEADRLKLPIYLETALSRMKPVYERYGFKTYHFWEEKQNDIRFWFLKREASGNTYERKL